MAVAQIETASDLWGVVAGAADNAYLETSFKELTLRVEIAKLAQLELLNKNLEAIGVALRNRS